MRKQIALLAMSLLFIYQVECLAWGNKKTHPALTAKAVEIDDVVDDYLKNQLDINQGLQTQLTWNFPSDIGKRLEKGAAEPSKTTRTVLEWIKAGSTIEDEDGRKWPHRPRHHFHDPIRDFGLENQTDHPNWENYACTWTGFDLTGESALHWAAVGTAWQEPTTNNHYWGKTREEFYKALTESNESVREESLAKTFLNLGHVLHLIEDMGVPAHARNDFIEAHYRGIKSPLNFKENPLEKHVENEIEHLGEIPTRWLEGWTSQAKVFSKLADYWDVNDYLGQYVGASPLSNWGLSEQTNYQFLSKSTIFREDNGNKYYFPQPNVNNVTGYVEPGVYYWNSVPVNYRYISGYEITHLARNKFIEIYAIPIIPYPVATVAYHTTFDDAVYEDYAKVTITRTIDYVTSLVNYFFRGILEVDVQGTETSGVAEITITNKSVNSDVEQALKGGDFELYAYCIDGQAAPVELTLNGWSNGILAYDDSLTGTFNIPSLSSLIAYYGVVYKGQIVPDADTGHVDPDDPDAIAYGKTAKRAILYFGNCSEWYENNPSWFDDDLAAFRNSCNDWKVGFYYTPRQWFDDPCPYCCTYTIADIIPSGYDFPEEIYFETLTVIPATSSDINNYIYKLLGGATAEILVIIHHDRETMYYTEDDWIAWLSNPDSNNPNYPYPGPGGILRTALIDWVANYVPNGYTSAYLVRHPDDTWLWVINDIIQQLNQ